MIVYVACAASALISGKEAYQNDRITFEDHKVCSFSVGEHEFAVTTVDAHHIVCLTKVSIEAFSEMDTGALKYAGGEVGQFRFQVGEVKDLQNGVTEVELLVKEGKLDVEDFVTHINQLARAV